jgi:hypothetical protein
MAWEFADGRVRAATVHPAPREDEVVATVTADGRAAPGSTGEALGPLPDGQLGAAYTRRARFWAPGRVDDLDDDGI